MNHDQSWSIIMNHDHCVATWGGARILYNYSFELETFLALIRNHRIDLNWSRLIQIDPSPLTSRKSLCASSEFCRPSCRRSTIAWHTRRSKAKLSEPSWAGQACRGREHTLNTWVVYTVYKSQHSKVKDSKLDRTPQYCLLMSSVYTSKPDFGLLFNPSL